MSALSLWKVLAVLVEWLASAYSFLIIIRTLLSWLGPMPYHPLVRHLKRITDPVLRLVHRYLPFAIVSGIDISPMIVLLVIYFGKNAILNLIYRAALVA